MARPEGIEPPTHRLEICCSIQLSYGRVLDGYGFFTFFSVNSFGAGSGCDTTGDGKVGWLTFKILPLEITSFIRGEEKPFINILSSHKVNEKLKLSGKKSIVWNLIENLDHRVHKLLGVFNVWLNVENIIVLGIQIQSIVRGILEWQITTILTLLMRILGILLTILVAAKCL